MKNNFFLRLVGAAALFAGGSVTLFGQISVDSVVTSNLFEPYAIAATADGTSYITDGANHRIVRVANGGTVATLLAGQTGVPGTNDGFVEFAHFNFPQGIVFARGGLVVADSANHTLRFVTFNGQVTTLAGAPGAYGLVNGPADAARFRYPLGLAADADGNIYIADSQNNAIRKLDTNNNVTTVASGFFQPAGMAVGENGDLWVADTRRHCIKVVSTNGTVTLVAGVPNVSGTSDSLLATNAQFSSPRGLLWVSANSGLLVSDSGNHTIRRVFWNTNYNTYSVELFAGVPGVSGAQNGSALSATFNSPVGLSFDQFSGGFLVVDKANNQVRRINTGVVQVPVADPQIGWMEPTLISFSYFGVFRPVVSAVFNNEVIISIIGEDGTQTYYTIGDTPANPLEDIIPNPAVGFGNTPPPCEPVMLVSLLPPTISEPQPDITIKAIGTLSGRRSSSIVRARFQFQVANPTIVGDNAASFKILNITTNAEMWYTWDGSEPTNNPAANTNVFGPILTGQTLSFNIGDSNRTFKIRGFRDGFQPSDVSTRVFEPDNFAANTISLGFSGGEASSDFVGAAGQRFYAPVTLEVLPGQKMYSLQFNAVATNLTGTAIDPTSVAFESMLKELVVENVYITIPPAMSLDGSGNLTSLVISNTSINLLEVGWIERHQFTNLYNTLEQDLITYSIAHDTLFKSENSKVIAGGYSFVIPITAPQGSTYQIRLGRASATSDGVSQDVYIKIPTNGAPAGGEINGIKVVTVGSRPYIVGDSAPFRWFNAGDFGNGFLLNNDVVQTFQSAVYQVNYPPPGSDFFDVMDSSDGSVNNLFTGDIDNMAQLGDGQLNVDDVYVTFRRSLDPSLKWFARYWSNGVRQVVEVPNVAPQSASGPGKKPASSPKSLPNGTPSVIVSADDIVGSAGSTVQVPIRLRVTGGLPIRVAMLGVSVQALDGSPEISTPISLDYPSVLGAPTVQNSKSANNAAAAWLNATVSGVQGDAVVATVTVTIPPNAPANAAYRVHFDHFSASENGIALFRKYVYDGLVTLADRSGSTWGDGISDAWRLRFFGALLNPLSAATADADGDGANNLAEFRAGTNPTDGRSTLRLLSAPSGSSAIKLMFPTGTGRTYVIESASDLGGTWTPISTNAGDGGMREYLNTPVGGPRFYRIRAE